MYLSERAERLSASLSKKKPRKGLDMEASHYAKARLRLAEGLASWHPGAKLHAYIHDSEKWAHRAYLTLVGVEVKYWYGKAAIAILVIEVLAYLMHEGGE